jgi:hypothetical protein
MTLSMKQKRLMSLLAKAQKVAPNNSSERGCVHPFLEDRNRNMKSEGWAMPLDAQPTKHFPRYSTNRRQGQKQKHVE